jgi:hypothetical protein
MNTNENLGFSLSQTKDSVNRGFCLWSCQLWLYLLLLSCEIGQVLWLFSCSTVWRVYRFLISFSWIPIIIDIFFDRLLSFSKLSEYRCRIRFEQYRIDFVSKKKNIKMKVIWPPIDRFRPCSSLSTPHVCLARSRPADRCSTHTLTVPGPCYCSPSWQTRSSSTTRRPLFPYTK